MNNFGKPILVCALAALLAGSTLSAGAAADDFRIETKVYVGKETEPASEDLTLFRGEQVYDFLNKPVEITVFDKPRSRVILLDPVRRVKAEMTMERIMAFSDELRTWCGKQADPLLKFAAEPSFDQSLDGTTGELVFTSPFLTYRVATVKAGTDDIARQYLEFSNSYARLNAMTNPGSTPPFPRLKIDEALFVSHAIPAKVQLTIPPRSRFGGKPMIVRSEHSVNWRLLESDQQKIQEAEEFLVTFTPLTLERYLGSAPPAPAKR
ncbi:MAG TPA: hypothetical protein VHX65_03570 [Pirellulales bacterium]|jgi:hypothetical protein|nr:hypothetical protein [Pirellulales bacterium]